MRLITFVRACTHAGVISLTAMGLGVSEEAAQEAGGAAQRASQLLEQLFPAVLAAFRCVFRVYVG